MRVLTIGNRYPPEGFGGYEALWHDSVRWLKDRGHEVTVLACDLPVPVAPEAPEQDAWPQPPGDPPRAREPGVLRELRWYWRDHEFPPLGFRERLALEQHNRAVLRRALQDTHADVVAWFSMGGMSLSLLEQVRVAGKPAVGVIGDEWLAYGPKVDAWTRGWRRLPGPATFAGIPTRYEPATAARWIFISHRLVQRARDYGVDPGEPVVAHPGVEPGLFSKQPAHNWRNDLLYAGRIDPRKGIETAVRALALLPGATLTVDGDGEEGHRDELGRLAAELNVGGRLVFARTPRERLGERYGGADVLLHPVRWEEPWGLAPLEAMACGTPVVATGMGGSGEYLTDRGNALLHAAGDHEALAVAIASLRDDPELRERLRQAGLQTASRFGATDFFDALERALTDATA